MNKKFICLFLIILTLSSRLEPAANKRETTIFHKAATWNNHKSLLQLMVTNKDTAALNALDHKGWTPLHHAAFNGNSVYLELLLAYGANVHAPTKKDGTLHNDAADFSHNYTTALHQAIRAGHFACAVILINAGANVNAQDWNGATPLHEAAYRGQYTCVEMLLEYNADGTLLTKCNKTADQVALDQGFTTIATLLYQERKKNEPEEQSPENKESNWWSLLCF